MAPVLKAKNIFKSFQATPALVDAGLELRSGEIHALMGENGAGKSTLIKVITGFHQKDSGHIFLNGNEISPPSNFEAQKLGISTVYQEVNLIPSLSVAENIFLGREPRRWGRIDWGAVRRGAVKALARLDLHIDVDTLLEDYPIALQQMTAIARALDMSAKVLILDEATSSLDAGEVEKLFLVLRKLKNEGLAILFVSHFFDQVYSLCDRVTILRNGRFVDEKKITEISRSELISKMMGHELYQLDEKKKSSLRPPIKGEPWLRCRDVGRKGSLKPFSLELQQGQTMGLAGLLGSGRTEVAHILFGIDEATSGTMEVDGKKCIFKNPAEAIRQGFALCPEDRKSQSIFPGLSLRKNLILAYQSKLGWFKTLSLRRQSQMVNDFIQALGIRARDADQSIETLSGGNQQKVILARWLALDPRLLILDEPMRGIDVGAKSEIQKYISNLQSENKSMVFISSELEEVVRNSDRVSVFKDRQKIAELGPDSISKHSIIDAIGGTE